MLNYVGSNQVPKSNLKSDDNIKTQPSTWKSKSKRQILPRSLACLFGDSAIPQTGTSVTQNTNQLSRPLLLEIGLPQQLDLGDLTHLPRPMHPSPVIPSRVQTPASPLRTFGLGASSLRLRRFKPLSSVLLISGLGTSALTPRHFGLLTIFVVRPTTLHATRCASS